MSVSERPRRVYRYVIDHDRGFAPNPFFGVCTLACCKPKIRKHARKGDIIVGFGPKKHGLDGQIIYWMSVDEISDFESYWNDPRFRSKRPQMGGSLSLCFGDNIYHRCPNTGAWLQEASFHSDPNSLVGLGNYRRDTGSTDRVLIGNQYAYWGAAGPRPPRRFNSLIKTGRGEQFAVECEDLKEEFVDWLHNLPDRGFRFPPADWALEKKIRALFTVGEGSC